MTMDYMNVENGDKEELSQERTCVELACQDIDMKGVKTAIRPDKQTVTFFNVAVRKDKKSPVHTARKVELEFTTMQLGEVFHLAGRSAIIKWQSGVRQLSEKELVVEIDGKDIIRVNVKDLYEKASTQGLTDVQRILKRLDNGKLTPAEIISLVSKLREAGALSDDGPVFGEDL